MADSADRSDQDAEIYFAAQIERVKNQEPEATATGYCLECFEITPDGHRWCGPECRDMWQARQK